MLGFLASGKPWSKETNVIASVATKWTNFSEWNFFSRIGLARTIPCKVFEQLVLFGKMVTNVSRAACELELFQSLLKPPQVDATALK